MTDGFSPFWSEHAQVSTGRRYTDCLTLVSVLQPVRTAPQAKGAAATVGISPMTATALCKGCARLSRSHAGPALATCTADFRLTLGSAVSMRAGSVQSRPRLDMAHHGQAWFRASLRPLAPEYVVHHNLGRFLLTPEPNPPQPLAAWGCRPRNATENHDVQLPVVCFFNSPARSTAPVRGGLI